MRKTDLFHEDIFTSIGEYVIISGFGLNRAVNNNDIKQSRCFSQTKQVRHVWRKLRKNVSFSYISPYNLYSAFLVFYRLAIIAFVNVLCSLSSLRFLPSFAYSNSEPIFCLFLCSYSCSKKSSFIFKQKKTNQANDHKSYR